MILYYCPDIKMKSDGLNRIYRHVDMLVQNGFPAAILHRQEGFVIQDQPAVPIKYLQTDHVLGPDDIVVIPEAYYGIMDELKNIPVRKFVISLSWTFVFGLPIFWDWRKLNIERALVVSPFIGKMISWAMNIPVHLLNSSIDHSLYYYNPSEKKCQISYIGRKGQNITPLKRMLETRNERLINDIEWKELKGLTEKEYAAEIRASSIFLNLSREEGLLTGCLKAMAAGAIVAGFNSIGGQDLLVGNGNLQNCLLCQNGDYISLAYELEPLILDVILDVTSKKLTKGNWNQIIENGQKLSSQYTLEKEKNSIIKFWSEILGYDKFYKKNSTVFKQDQIPELLAMAVQEHNKGNIQKAKSLYKQILSINPEHVDALHLLGLISYQSDHLEEALFLINKAIKIMPDEPVFYNNLSLVLLKKGNMDEAEKHCKKAIDLKNDYAEAHNNYGNILKQKGELEKACRSYKNALKINPDSSEAHNNLSVALTDMNELELAKKHCNVAIQLNPKSFKGYYNLGNIYNKQDNVDEAAKSYKNSLAINPNFYDAHNNLGAIYSNKFQFEAARIHFTKAFDLRPNMANSHYNLACVLHEQGLLNEAVDKYKSSLKIDPDYKEAQHNHLNCLNYIDEKSPDEIYLAHVSWGKFIEDSSQSISHINTKNPDKKLRIGYTSPDFRFHPVAFFIEQIFAHHNKKEFEIFCYANVIKPDHVTDRLKTYVHKWTDIRKLPDDEVCKKVQEDQIDILIDLAGHTRSNRLEIFARKPAPVQVSYLGYPNTTGLSTMDYLITDEITDPSGISEKFYTEKLIRLPSYCYCYLPPQNSYNIAPLPAIKNGFITFGSFQHFAKISKRTLSLWINILKNLKNSKLIIQAKPLNDQTTINEVMHIFKTNGIDERRIILNGFSSFDKYMELHNEIDIMLDTLPWNGHTTSCHALWMGVPIITLTGNRHSGRLCTSLLLNLCLNDWVATNEDEYIQKSILLSNDLNRLSHIRKNLRDHLVSSRVCDGKRFTASLEETYKMMWLKH